jgi:5-methylcytosine-specific restriction endonuclease McrA
MKDKLSTNDGVLKRPVLVLNASYEPINICAVKRAVVLVIKGKANMEAQCDKTLYSPTVQLNIPAVIRLTYFVKIPFRIRPFSKKNLFLRDQYTCQYCGNDYEANELTLDHVVPRSRGGESSWENTVTCCKKCNEKKGGHLPAEIGMNPIKKPRAPLFISSFRMARIPKELESSWQKYLYF